MQQAIQIAPAPVAAMNTQADNDLRAQLAASLGHGSHPPPPPSQQQHQQHQQPPSSHGYGNDQNSNSASPHDHNIDPAIGGSAISQGMMANSVGGSGGGGDSGGDDSMGDGKRGGKRELSSSKRAAQNRAAQRAFRQRKEGYIKKLEEQVRDLHSLEDNFKAVQAENYSLREYIIHLQSRLIESQGDYPQPPANVTLSHPHARSAHEIGPHSVAATGSGSGAAGGASAAGAGSIVAPLAPMSQLQASAARALQSGGGGGGGGGAPGQVPSGKSEASGRGEEQNDEDIIRNQLQASNSGLPVSM